MGNAGFYIARCEFPSRRPHAPSRVVSRVAVTFIALIWPVLPRGSPINSCKMPTICFVIETEDEEMKSHRPAGVGRHENRGNKRREEEEYREDKAPGGTNDICVNMGLRIIVKIETILIFRFYLSRNS